MAGKQEVEFAMDPTSRAEPNRDQIR